MYKIILICVEKNTKKIEKETKGKLKITKKGKKIQSITKKKTKENR